MNCENSNSESGITQNNLQNSPLSGNASVNDMSMCSCGCCFEVGSEGFMKLHVEPECTCPEQPCPKCVIPEMEQRDAEEEASRQFHEEELQATHPFGCNCSECN